MAVAVAEAASFPMIRATLISAAIAFVAPHALRAQVEALTRANVVNVESGMIERDRTLVLEPARRTANAMQRWEEAIATNVTSPDQWSFIGRALYDTQHYRESVAAFERAVQLRPDSSSDAAWNIARAYAQLGNRKQAERWLEHAAQLGSRSARELADARRSSPGKRLMLFRPSTRSGRGIQGLRGQS